MNKVTIYFLDSAGTQYVGAECSVVDGAAVCTGDETFITNITTQGMVTSDGATVYPRDGDVFLQAIVVRMRGPYAYAEEVKE